MSAGTAYSKRFPGGFVDLPSQTTDIDQLFLNAVETALLQLIGSAPTADGQVAQWDNANTRFGPALLLNKNVDPAAAIASSKIDFTGGNALTNAAIAGAAAIARSKLDFGSGLVNADVAAAAAIALTKLNIPGGTTQFARADGTWAVPPSAVTFRSNTQLDIVNTAAESDLLNQALAGNTIGVNGIMRVKLGMDYINTSGGGINETMRVYLGATKVFDSGAIAMIFGSRLAWSMDINMVNLGVANSQNWYGQWNVVENGTGTFTTGEGTPAPAGGTSSLPWAFVGSALDTTASQTLRVTIQHGSGLPSVSVRRLGWLVEVI